MIWHIIGKDWKLLWRLVVGVALINCIERYARSGSDLFAGRGEPLLYALSMLEPMLLLATGILIALVVQQDAIPGLRQDWLVRPIRRSDLLWSKLLFVAILVQGPILIAEVVQGLAAGFPIGHAIGAPLSRNLTMLIAFDLPIVAFAALTRNLMEAVAGAIVAGLVAILFVDSTLITQLRTGDAGWVTDSLRTVWGLVTAACILSLLYFGRKIRLARWAFASATVVWLFVAWLPWQTAFAFQTRFSPRPEAADAIRLAFDAGAGKPSPGFDREAPNVYLGLPMQAKGIANGDLLMVDRATALLTARGGRIIDLGSSAWLQGYRDGPFRQTITVPSNTFWREQDRPERLEIDYSLTVMKPAQDRSMPVSSPRQWIEGLGVCGSRPAEAHTVDTGCMMPGPVACFTAFVANVRTGVTTPGHSECKPDSAPYFGRIPGDSLGRFATRFELLPTDQVQDLRMVWRVYTAEAHFTRKVVIPDIRLGDWRAE